MLLLVQQLPKIKTVQRLNPAIMQYIEGIIKHYARVKLTPRLFLSEKIEAKWLQACPQRDISEVCGYLQQEPCSQDMRVYIYVYFVNNKPASAWSCGWPVVHLPLWQLD